jgi:SAM-dependent methyltransferase
MLDEIKKRGVDVFGLEYSTAALRRCRERGLKVEKFDIENYRSIPDIKYDIALSLEVAEHLPENVADRYVRLLCRVGRIVICSAAQPGQGGVDHVNLKMRSYWVSKFEDQLFKLDTTAVEVIAENWRSNLVIPFYYENLMIFSS